MKKDTNTNTWIVVGVILIIIILGWWYMDMNTNQGPGPANPVTYQSVPKFPEVGMEDTSAPSVDAGKAPMAYADALIKYPNARLQLDTTCQAFTNQTTFKNNTLLMVDNRAPVSRTVRVGSVFTVKAYSFKIVNLSSATLPATWLVDCDKSQNVATIKLEK